MNLRLKAYEVAVAPINDLLNVSEAQRLACALLD